jgi:hypothetical protein
MTRVGRRPGQTVAAVERALGLPAKKWAGSCYAIACQIVEHKLVQGVAVYGHWLGRVHPKSMFAGKLLIHHGWINLTEGGILDPTRWEFEQTAPYIFWSPTVGSEYDEGGNKFRAANIRPPPAFDEPFGREPYQFAEKDMPPATWQWMEQALKADFKKQPPHLLSCGQLFWLANLPLDALGPHAKPLFEAIKKLGSGQAAVPIDNWKRVMEGRWP